MVERKNRSLQEMTWIMLIYNLTPKHFWFKTMNIDYYLQNKYNWSIIYPRILSEIPFFHIQFEVIHMTFQSIDIY